MRIDKLYITNFKAFADAQFEFHPNFNLIVGENGAGKTSLLKAIAVALGAWSYGFPVMPFREIDGDEVRRNNQEKGGRPTMEPLYPSHVRAYGRAFNKTRAVWQRTKEKPGATTKINSSPEDGYDSINFKFNGERIAGEISRGESRSIPLVACYSTGRLWQKQAVEANQAGTGAMAGSVFSGYEDCFSARTSEDDLKRWLLREIGAVASSQVPDAVLNATKVAIRNMLPDAAEIHAYYIPIEEIVIEFQGGSRVAFSSLSDGQRTLLNLAGDIARRAVMLNPHLGGRALLETEGVVLIDELDLHLHPRWQRHVVANLRQSFPRLQFFSTTHSPQIVGETPADQIMILRKDGSWTRPHQTIGLSTNQVLANIMGADAINQEMAARFNEVFSLVEQGEFDAAKEKIAEIRGSENQQFPELTEAESYMDAVDAAAKEEDGA